MCVWFTVNKLTMIITLNPLICYLEAYAHKEFNKQMQNVNMVTQFLGVFIDEHLNWKAQIKYVKSKLSKSTDTLHKCSHLFHINSNSGDTPNKYQQYVLMQKRVIRIVLGARRLDHTNSIFQQLHVLKFPYIVLQLYAIKYSAFVYKTENSLFSASQSWFWTTECLLYYAINVSFCKGSAHMEFSVMI